MEILKWVVVLLELKDTRMTCYIEHVGVAWMKVDMIENAATI